ncbi:MAG: MBL fold metallo-hydrolase [Candidatus Aminicenantes bacterium]|nr:MBL fold metallo-hydrolase [Candidatus Aminicenantes bacterium]
MKKLCVSLALLALSAGLLLASSPAQPAPASQEPPPLKLEQITGRIYEAKGGSGANAGVFLGKQETLVIDAKMSEETARQMLEEIKKLSPHPIGYIVLTHSDGDHVNGLPGFPEGIKIIAHANTLRDLEEAFKEEKLRACLPQITFRDKYELKLEDDTVWLLHFGPAHTSGDVVVYFPAEKVAFLGDLFFKGRDPLVHRHKNGNSFGLVKVLKAVLELDAETFLSGHADRAARGDIEALIQSLEERQSRIKALVEEGKSLDEVKKIFGIEDRPEQPGRRRWLSLPEIIYLELTEKK